MACLSQNVRHFICNNPSDWEQIEWKWAISSRCCLHIAADSSVVVCLGGPALQPRAHLYSFLKRDVLYIAGTAAGSQLGWKQPVPSDPPQNQTHEAQNDRFKYGCRCSSGTTATIWTNISPSPCSLAKRGSKEHLGIVSRFVRSTSQ